MSLESLLVVAAIALLLLGVFLNWRNWEQTRRKRNLKLMQKEDIARYLHDSVLQTLALISQNAGNAEAVAKLSRTQERELRRWLYGEVENTGDSLARSLEVICQTVEEQYSAEVELVIVGDAKPTAEKREMLKAVTQAIVNACQHGKPPINVYAELSSSVVEMTVRDHGDGINLEKVPDDRGGVRSSIIGRMLTLGGSAKFKSKPGWGTEVVVRLLL